jgi:hypothetical protein
MTVASASAGCRLRSFLVHRGSGMFRKFVEGLVFGTGFCLAVLVIGMIGASAIFSTLPITHRSESFSVPMGASESTDDGDHTPFYELSFEEQVEAASVIAVARFEPAEDGRMKAVLTEILKKKEGTRFRYNIGDEYSHASYYPKEGMSQGDGVVIFFEGSPATMRSSMSYSGDRIGALGDMPLKLFRDKCDDSKISTSP